MTNTLRNTVAAFTGCCLFLFPLSVRTAELTAENFNYVKLSEGESLIYEQPYVLRKNIFLHGNNNEKEKTFAVKNGSQFEGADMRGLRYSKNAAILHGSGIFLLKNVSWKHCALSRSDFSQILFSNTSFDAANIVGTLLHVDASCHFQDAVIGEMNRDRVYDRKPSKRSGIDRDPSAPGIIISGMTGEQIKQTKNYAAKVIARCTFIGSNFKQMDFSGINFYRTSFVPGYRETNRQTGEHISLGGSQKNVLTNCKFDNADLRKVRFVRVDLTDSSFANADLRGCFLGTDDFGGGNQLTKCRFSGANVEGAEICGLTKEQLMETGSFQNGELIGMKIDLPDLKEIDFSRFNLTGTDFSEHCDFSGATLNDAVISGCTFMREQYGSFDELLEVSVKGLTAEQIKSTHNYKTGKMTGIALPQKIREQLGQKK